jgi:hypothetical protein
VSLGQATRDATTISVIHDLPVAAPPLREEIARKTEAGRNVSSAMPLKGGTCPNCGGKTKIKILKYWCDSMTDIVTPADTLEHCECGWNGPIVEHERPL